MLDKNIFLALFVTLLEAYSILLVNEYIPLGTVAHRQDKLRAYQEHASKAKHRENVQPNIVPKWIERRIRQRPRNEEKC